MNRLFTIYLIVFFARLTVSAEAQSDRLVFDLKNPQEAERWIVEETSQGTPAFERTSQGLKVQGIENESIVLIRPVQFEATTFNKMIVRMNSMPEVNPTGYTNLSVYFSKDPSNLFGLAESVFRASPPANTFVSVPLDLDQSLLWYGDIQSIRVDPLFGAGTVIIDSVTLLREEKEAEVPAWNFSREEAQTGWNIGEFVPSFVPGNPKVSDEGMTFSSETAGISIMMPDIHIDSEKTKALEMKIRYNDVNIDEGLSNTARLNWAANQPGAYSKQQRVDVDLNLTNEFQTVTFELENHPEWNGEIRSFSINPILRPANITVSEIRFIAADTLGSRGDQRALINWMSHQEVQNALSDNYKPLLVFITLSRNSFSRKTEADLAKNVEFLSLANNYHCVRMEATNPVVEKTFGRLYKIPAVIIMTHDSSNRSWSEKVRLTGSAVQDHVLNEMRKWRDEAN